ncbi:MAG: hypothetical protein DWQ04_31475 [Chloroflexi bacterium]|nr:MAG: hypothetical protein DWQ04_31475 [Chloroflexota bacterium]
MSVHRQKWQWVWLTALGCFVLAGSTGVLLRFGMLMGFPFGLQYVNVRHAHSHLMFMGWVTPALMGLMVVWLPELTGRPFSPKRTRQFKFTLIAVFVLSLMVYVPFLLFGYASVQIGDANMPLASNISGLNMISWYAFAWFYRQETKGVARIRPLRLMDAALVLLVLSTFGAWGLGLTIILGVQDPAISSSMTHMFLDLFSEGWFVLAMLGIIHAKLPALQNHQWLRRSEDALVMALPVIFLLGVPTHLLPMPVRLLGSLGALVVSFALWTQVVVVWRQVASVWRWPLGFLALKATANFLMTVPAVVAWAEQAGLRVPYLHWLLLGFVTLGLVGAARQVWDQKVVPHVGGLTAVIFLLLLSLIPLTSVWPSQLSGLWTRQFAAWVSIGPATIVLWFLVKRLAKRSLRLPTSQLEQLTESP